MNRKTYSIISTLVDSGISEIDDYFSLYTFSFGRKAQEIKAGSYGGYELTKLIGEFNQELNKKSAELLDNVEKLYVDSGRNLSAKQYDDLKNKCTKPFDLIIDNYSKAFRDEFPLSDTNKTALEVAKGRISLKISKHIKALKIISDTKMDKALWWTAIGVVFAGVSLVLSAIAIIISLYRS